MRDLSVTEKLDYFGAGASVMYGMYLAVVRIYRLELDDELYKPSLRRFWTGLCATLYLAHVAYLSIWKFDYTYNMAANVIVGLLHNVLWTWYSYSRYRQEYQAWTAWPGLIVTWVVMAMSLELLDFPPFMELIDAHSLWHLATVVPTLWWYK
ncbi:hypothetical protein KEM55_000867 [Ascosphaera atra]|nr:hypothetical protein KEM55_000867 [Ascosphaera atra]